MTPGASGRQHLEQPPLGGEVALHVAVEIEVVARQVGEDAGGEARCRRRAAAPARATTLPSRTPRSRGRPSRAAAAARPALRASCAPRRCSRRRCGTPTVPMQPAAHAGGVEDRRQQVRGRRLAVRAGDADERAARRSDAVERGREKGQRQPRVARPDPGHAPLVAAPAASDTTAIGPRATASAQTKRRRRERREGRRTGSRGRPRASRHDASDIETRGVTEVRRASAVSSHPRRRRAAAPGGARATARQVSLRVTGRRERALTELEQHTCCPDGERLPAAGCWSSTTPRR